MKLYCVYQHRDIEGKVFYVGCCSSNPAKRGVRAKLQRAYATGGHSSAWHERACVGYTVDVLEMFTDRVKAFAREIEVIADRRNSGCKLVNISTGGAGARGVIDPPEVRAKKAITKIGDLNPMYSKTGIKHPNSRPVVNIQNGVFYESLIEAAESLGYKMQTLHKRLTGRLPNKTLWRFA